MDVFMALADPVRRSLLLALGSGPARVVDLAAGRPISRPAVSKHLRILAEAGLVTATEHGRERHYSLTPAGLSPVADLLAELRGAGSRRLDGSVLDALDTEVRRTTRQRRSGRSSQAADETHEETA